jgi:hypothetical protein
VLLKGPLNFPPVLARWIVDEYAPENGMVLDPCAGYGGRLLGVVASSKNVRYVGCDPEPRTVRANKLLARWLEVEERIEMLKRAVEDDSPWPNASLVFTGPPYFDRELYGDAAVKLLKRYDGFEGWVEGFLFTLVSKSLQSASMFVLNVSVVRNRKNVYDIPMEVKRLVGRCGGRVERILNWKTPSFGGRKSGERLIIARRD